MIEKDRAYVLLAALILGLFIVLQGRAYKNVNDLLLRDAKSNIFQEIKVLKEKNNNLRKEIDELERTFEQLADQNSSLEAIEEEIKKYQKLSGKFGIFGPGIEVAINGNITTPWAIDLINEFFNSGAEAVSVNGIRLVNKTIGFDTLPQGQILLNGSILSPPYTFNVLGEPSTLLKALNLPEGIFARLTKAFPSLKIGAITKEIIQMN